MVYSVRPLLVALLLAFGLAGSAQAFSLNPVNWFVSAPKALPAATPAEQAAANKLLAEGQDQLERERTRAADRTLKKLVKNFPTASAAPEARYLLAVMEIDAGKFKRAFKELQFIVDRHPNYPDFNKVIERQFDIAEAMREGARGRILFVFPGFSLQSQAIEYYEQVVRNAPYSNYAPVSLLNIALVARDRNKDDEAIDALDRLINYYPESLLAPTAYLNLADTYASLVKGHRYDQGATRKAISYYEDFLILFPDNENVADAEAGLARMRNLSALSRLNLGEFYYLNRNNNTAALVFYNEAVTQAPDSESAAIARQRIYDIEAGVRPSSSFRVLRQILFVPNSDY